MSARPSTYRIEALGTLGAGLALMLLSVDFNITAVDSLGGRPVWLAPPALT